METDPAVKINTTLVIFKVGVAVCLLLLGGHITLWAMDIVERFINNPESIAMVNQFVQLGNDVQSLEVMVNGEQISVSSNNVFKWIVLILLFVVLFNIVGRALSGIFSCLGAILMSIGLFPTREKARQEKR